MLVLFGDNWSLRFMCDDYGCRTFFDVRTVNMCIEKSCCFFGHRKIEYTEELGENRNQSLRIGSFLV